MTRTQRWAMAGAAAGALGTTWLLERARRRQRQREANRSLRALVLGSGPLGRLYGLALARGGVWIDYVPDISVREHVEAVSVRLHTHGPSRLRDVSAPVHLQGLFGTYDYDLVLVDVPDEGLQDVIAALGELPEQEPLVLLREHPLTPEAQTLLGDRTWLVAIPGALAVEAQSGLLSLPLWRRPTVIGETDRARSHRLQQAARLFERANLDVEVTDRIQERATLRAIRLLALIGAEQLVGLSMQALRSGTFGDVYRGLVAEGLTASGLTSGHNAGEGEMFWRWAPWLLLPMPGLHGTLRESLGISREWLSHFQGQLIESAAQSHLDVSALQAVQVGPEREER